MISRFSPVSPASFRFVLSPFIFLCMTAFVLSGCAGLSAPPTAKVQQQQSIESLAADQAFSKTETLDTPGTVTGTLAKGQWVTTLTRYKAANGDRTLSTTKVIDVQGDRVTLEIETYTASGNAERNVLLLQLEGYALNLPLGPDQAALNTMAKPPRIVRMMTQNGSNPPMEVPSMALQFASGFTQKFTNPAVRTTPMITQTVETPYMKVKDARVFDVTVSIMGKKHTGKVKAHGGIPINNQIVYEDAEQVTWTIAYGMKGAEQTLFFPKSPY